MLRELPRSGRHRVFECRCDCGNICSTRGTLLSSGDKKSCGCLRKEIAKKRAEEHRTHGFSRTRLYYIWADMKRRCYSKKRKNFPNYGGRGIKVCDDWLNDFFTFKEWAFQNGYNNNLTIDRIDVDGNYEPKNCRWATNKEQANNKRNNLFLELDGEKHTLQEWSKLTGIKYSTIQKRISERGWTIKEALTIKDGRKK